MERTETRTTPSWRDRLRAWARPPRELSFTTSGKFFFLLTLGIGFGAVNTGNNLLFLLLGMMLSLILASGILSEAVLRELEARRRLPDRIVAGHPAPGEFVLENPRAWASLSVEVADRTARTRRGPRAGARIGLVPVPWWKFWRGASKERPLASAYTVRISGKDTETLDCRYEFPHRGMYELESLTIVTRFPFGLFEKSRRIQEACETLVFPEPIDPGDWMTEVRGRFGDVESQRRGRGEEYFGLRDYRAGEDRRSIHWKVSARRGSLVVRENEEQQQRAVEILFCDFRDDGASIAADHFEHAVGKTAGLIGMLSSSGYRVGLRTSEEHVPVAAHSSTDRMLAALAVCARRKGLPDWSDDGRPPPARILIGTAAQAARISLPFDLHLDTAAAGPA